MNRKLILALYKVIAESILKWSDDYSGDDLNDAIDHANLMRNRQMQKGFNDLEFIEIKKADPRNLLRSASFKGKPFGWLKNNPKEIWVEEFKKIYYRDISYILRMKEDEELPPPIVVDGDLSDGYGRVLLAYALGEHVPVAYFKGIIDDK